MSDIKFLSENVCVLTLGRYRVINIKAYIFCCLFHSLTVELHIRSLSLCGILDAIFGPKSIKYAC